MNNTNEYIKKIYAKSYDEGYKHGNIILKPGLYRLLQLNQEETIKELYSFLFCNHLYIFKDLLENLDEFSHTLDSKFKFILTYLEDKYPKVYKEIYSHYIREI